MLTALRTRVGDLLIWAGARVIPDDEPMEMDTADPREVRREVRAAIEHAAYLVETYGDSGLRLAVHRYLTRALAALDLEG
jgi:hypothetical protein